MGIDEFNPALKDILSYLSDLFDEGKGYSVINTARSALSSFISIKGRPCGQDPDIVRFLRGVYNLRPALPRYTTTWNANIVLNYYREHPLGDIKTLKDLTIRTAFILALSSGQRIATLRKLKLDWINQEVNYLTIYNGALTKTSRPGKHQAELKFQVFDGSPNICVVNYLNLYLERTKQLRSPGSNLFISFQKPHKNVSTDTLARWIKLVMKNAGINTTTFKAHSTRSALSAKLKGEGERIDTIMNIVGWSNEKTFAKFYDKPIC